MHAALTSRRGDGSVCMFNQQGLIE